MRMMLVKRLEHKDLSTRVEWFNTPSVYNQMTVEAPLSLAATDQWFTGTVLNESRRDFTFLLSEDGVQSAAAMGGLVDIDQRHRHAELYIVVNPGMTSQGIGQRCVHWLCNFGFVRLGLARIYLYTLGTNKGARRLYERLGFVREGVLRKHVYHNGLLLDRYVHSLLKEEWQKQVWCIGSCLSLEIPLDEQS